VSETVFGRILSGELPADVVYEDDRALAFRDTNPQAPTHVLVIPRKPIARLSESGAEDTELLATCSASPARWRGRRGSRTTAWW